MNIEHRYMSRNQLEARIGELESEVVRLTDCLKKANDGFEKYERLSYLRLNEIEELQSQLNNRPESEAERAIVEYVAIDEVLDKPCAEWTNEECNRHYKAAQALKGLARKLAGETTTKGE